MRLIDADVLEESLENSCKDTYETKMFVDFMRYVDEAPTIKQSENCISRDLLLKHLENITMDTNLDHYDSKDKWYQANGFNLCKVGVEMYVEKLPSITPQPKVGHWIYEPRRRMIDETDNGAVYREEMWCKCSECGADFGYIKNEDRYCKFCGAKMEVEK